MAALFSRFRPDSSMPGLPATVRTAFGQVSDKRKPLQVEYYIEQAPRALTMAVILKGIQGLILIGATTYCKIGTCGRSGRGSQLQL